MDRSKEAVAQRLAEAHYALEPGIELIFHLVTSPDQEADVNEPVKLLEVNPATFASGIHPVFFGAHPASGLFYPSIVVEVTPDEYEEIRRNPSTLPNGWQIGREFERPIAAGQH